MKKFYDEISSALDDLEAEDHAYGSVRGYLSIARETKGQFGSRLIFIGNGGSAAIASHMATDYMKNGGLPTFCFNDGPLLTCITNDLGYESVFSLPLRTHGRLGDTLFAISSSGESKNILRAVDLALEMNMNIVTLSGFSPRNALRKKGGVNFYIPSSNYGVVEIAHLTILHWFLNEMMLEQAKELLGATAWRRRKWKWRLWLG